MDTKKCKFCKTEIDKKATVCPQCGRNQKSGSIGCLTIIFIIIIAFALPAVLTQNTIETNSGSNKSELITLSEYNQIQTGMTYDEVRNIIGSDGTLNVESGTDSYKIQMYSWYGNTITGANANFTFTNGKLTAKAQIGLSD